MSTAQVDTQQDTAKFGKRLTEPERRAIVAHYATCGNIGQTAQHFKVNRNTVTKLIRSVRNVPESPLSTGWREKLQNQLPAKAVDAIEASLVDREDVHKAASTAISVLKGQGILQGDGVNVTFNQLVMAAPKDVLEEYVSTSDALDVVDALPDNGASSGSDA